MDALSDHIGGNVDVGRLHGIDMSAEHSGKLLNAPGQSLTFHMIPGGCQNAAGVADALGFHPGVKMNQGNPLPG